MGYDLDPIDRQIVRILQQDGRLPNVEIARRVAVSEATVRKRMDRLVAEGLIRIVAIPNAGAVGFSTVTFIALEVDLAQVTQIADQLARLPEVRAIHYTTGESDLILEAWFPTSNDLLRFLTQHVASIPGIQHTATSHVLRTLKDASTWLLPTSPPRILVVDDDADFVEVTRVVLAAEGFEVGCACNGEEAMSLMRMQRPDLVILDVMMRGILDGLRTGHEMRTDGELRSVPVLMVSSITDSAFAGLLPRAGSLPADNFLVKPIDQAVLTAEVKRLLRAR
jgi:Lrp/AsnC family transcriptional regulator, regulator for asnA, asnC and gidA